MTLAGRMSRVPRRTSRQLPLLAPLTPSVTIRRGAAGIDEGNPSGLRALVFWVKNPTERGGILIRLMFFNQVFYKTILIQ